MNPGAVRMGLLAGIFVPVLYFGVQVLLAPTFPGYSFLRDEASLLGSDLSHFAPVFNGAAVLSGVCAILAALALFVAERGMTPVLLRILLGLVPGVAGLGNIWAGLLPMPHPLHASNPSTPALIALPFVMLAMGLVSLSFRGLRVYLVINALVVVLLVPMMAGLVPVDLAGFQGLLQRILAACIFIPVGVVCWHRLRQTLLQD